MTAQIHYSRDGKRYFITRDGCAPQFWLSVDTRPNPIDEVGQMRAQKTGKLWFNVEIARTGRTYRRAVFAGEVDHADVARSVPIAETHIRFKDYAIFHRWVLNAPVTAAA